MQDLTARLRLGQDETVVQTYGFWDGGDIGDPDVSPEAERAAATSADMVIAKSIGTRVTVMAARDHGFTPKACVFVGTPLRWFEAQDRLDWLREHVARTPTLLIQQTSDFNGPFDELAAVVADAPGARMVEVPGGDHVYEDLRVVAGPIARWWASEIA